MLAARFECPMSKDKHVVCEKLYYATQDDTTQQVEYEQNSK